MHVTGTAQLSIVEQMIFCVEAHTAHDSSVSCLYVDIAAPCSNSVVYSKPPLLLELLLVE